VGISPPLRHVQWTVSTKHLFVMGMSTVPMVPTKLGVSTVGYARFTYVKLWFVFSGAI